MGPSASKSESCSWRLIQSLDLIPRNSRFWFCHLVNPLRLPSASKSESCRWPLYLGIRLGACLSFVILPIHSDLAIRHDDSTLVFREYVSRLRSPSQQHLAIRCDDSTFAFHCVFTSISPRCVMPGYPSVSRRVDSSLTVGFSGRGIGADTRSIHNRMCDYSARMGPFPS